MKISSRQLKTLIIKEIQNSELSDIVSAENERLKALEHYHKTAEDYWKGSTSLKDFKDATNSLLSVTRKLEKAKEANHSKNK